MKQNLTGYFYIFLGYLFACKKFHSFCDLQCPCVQLGAGDGLFFRITSVGYIAWARSEYGSTFSYTQENGGALLCADIQVAAVIILSVTGVKVGFLS